jgi:hypothetical protein
MSSDSVKIRCYECGLVEFTVPVGTSPKKVVCENCFAKRKMQQALESAGYHKTLPDTRNYYYYPP